MTFLEENKLVFPLTPGGILFCFPVGPVENSSVLLEFFLILTAILWCPLSPGFYSLRFFGNFIPKKDDTIMTKVRHFWVWGGCALFAFQDKRTVLFQWLALNGSFAVLGNLFVSCYEHTLEDFQNAEWVGKGCALFNLDGVHSLCKCREPQSLLTSYRRLPERTLFFLQRKRIANE